MAVSALPSEDPPPRLHFTAEEAPLTIAGHLIKNVSGSRREQHTCVCLISSPPARWCNGEGFKEAPCSVFALSPFSLLIFAVYARVWLQRLQTEPLGQRHCFPHAAAVVGGADTSRCGDVKEGGPVWSRLIGGPRRSALPAAAFMWETKSGCGRLSAHS